MKQDLSLNRRRLLVGSTALAIHAAVGCRQDTEVTIDATPERRDVPLRITLVGDEKDAESIRRGWAAVTEHPVSMQSMELNRADAGSLAESLLAVAKKSDLVVYPLALVAELVAREAIVALSDDEFDQIGGGAGNLFPALRNGVGRYAGEHFGVPLGASLPALLSVEDPGAVASWQAYDDLVEHEWSSMAGEPSSPGWAGAMFLWRTAGLKNWLFSRENLQPLIDAEPSVEALELMVQTNARYKLQQQTPDQIWSATKSGALQGGIGFPQTSIDSEIQFHVGNLPAINETSRVLLDPFSPLISLTSNCRQSATAKRFMQWISSGEGSGTVRQRVAGMTDLRRSSGAGGPSESISGGSYQQWLATRLNSPVTMPTLQILQGGEYYAALDQQISRALTGDATPRQALAEVAKQWQATTEKVGVDKQLRAWRRAQGMRT